MSCSKNSKYKLVKAIQIAKAMDRKISVDEIEQLLKEGENPDDSPRGVPPPLHLAVQFDYPDIAMLLLKAGCKVRASPLVEQLHPPIISNATARSMTRVVLLMCSRPDCDLFTVDTQLRTIVHIAAEKGNVDLLKGLRSLAGGDFEKFLFLRDGMGRTPLHIAALFGWVKVLKLLLYGDERCQPENTDNPQSEDLRSVPRGWGLNGDMQTNRDERSTDVAIGRGLNTDLETNRDERSTDVAIGRGLNGDLETNRDERSTDVAIGRGLNTDLETNRDERSTDVAIGRGLNTDLETNRDERSTDVAIGRGLNTDLETNRDERSTDVASGRGLNTDLETNRDERSTDVASGRGLNTDLETNRDERSTDVASGRGLNTDLETNRDERSTDVASGRGLNTDLETNRDERSTDVASGRGLNTDLETNRDERSTDVASGRGLNTDLETNRDERSTDVAIGRGLNGDQESLRFRPTAGDGEGPGGKQEEKRGRWVDHRVLGSKETMLHLAAQNHHLVVMQFLLSCGATVNARDMLHCTPLMMVMARDPDHKSAPGCAECLLKAGADWSLTGSVQTTMNSLPIHHHRHFSRLNQQVTAAMAAALRNRVDYLKLLSEFGDTFEGVSGCGMTPLMCALSTGSEEAARFLLSHHPEDTRFHTWADDAGATPLHLVSNCRSKAGELTQLLLDRGYGAVLHSPVTTRLPSDTHKALGSRSVTRGSTPVTRAIMNGRLDVLKALVAYHPGCLMETHPTALHSPLHVALTLPHPRSVPFVDFLLAHGADGNVIVEGLTPHQYAISTARSVQKEDEDQHPSAAYLKKKLGTVFMEWGEGAAGKGGSGSELWSLRDRCLERVRGIVRARTKSSYPEDVRSLPLPPSLVRALLFETES